MDEITDAVFSLTWKQLNQAEKAIVYELALKLLQDKREIAARSGGGDAE